MKKQLSALLFSLLILVFTAGCKKSHNNLVIDVSNIPENGLIIYNWYLVGPFLSNG